MEKEEDVLESDYMQDENAELTLLSAINAIVTLAEDSRLGQSFFDKADRYVTYLSERQGITKIQAVFLALIVESSVSSKRSDLSYFAKYLDCNNVQVLLHKGEIDDLVHKGIIKMVNGMRVISNGYVVSDEFLENLAKNEPYRQKSYKGSTGIEFFQHVYDITHLRYKDELSSELAKGEIGRLIDENPQLEYVKSLRNIGMTHENEMIITHMCRHLVLEGTDCLPIRHLGFLIEDGRERDKFERAMLHGKHYLIRNGWVENAFSEGFCNKEEFQMTEKARDVLLQGFDIKLNEDQSKGSDIVLSSSITAKELFFDSQVKQQLEGLAELLDENKYTSICDRLKQKGLRQGFACLFYGAPGTGKTESVLQLARATGRDIMQVNISQVKSKWVGESEKNIKAIFSRYRTVAKHSKRIPILLFNEADAVIGKRLEKVECAVDKMENSIQNIILQEMESLDGIMIATTNLVQNLDDAFDRRFLYKVKFEKPGLAQRTKIWQSMLPELSEQTAERLASCYDFSGGQIENIARKCDIQSILYGDDYVTEEKIEQYCKEEVLVKKENTKVGFALG